MNRVNKFMILTDMEGLNGVTRWEDVTEGTPSYERFRKILTRQIVHVCEQLKEKFGVVEVCVKDGHWTGY